ncbi:MAG: purine-nucleoside phosphorylase [Ignavibacteriaceae bacterium]|nr:purine-nucleoside phosphorylase [Ignavibacteriaceae bacterium]
MKYKDLVNLLKKKAPFIPEIALILGSGLGDFASSVELFKTISTAELPGYPPSTIIGHEGKIHFAKYEGKNLLLFQGRIHFYEGYSISECILPAFLSYKLGCTKIFITNAAGGINPDFHPGDLMLALSFNTFGIKKELSSLIGTLSEEGTNNLRDFPSNAFNNIIRQAAKKEKIDLKEGVYWYSKGPSYETPAEIRMMGKFSSDAVGMSTVHEALFAAYCGLDVASVSCITNYAAGISSAKLNHSEVTKTANIVKNKFERLVKRIISLI